jgi:hypothetical protein
MRKFTTAKIVAIVVPAVLFAGAAAHFIVPDARAESEVAGAPAPFAKGDHLHPLVMASECSSRGWPHYEQSCQFDLRGLEHQARTVRIIALR